MKKWVVLTACVCAFGASFAQTTNKDRAKLEHKLVASGKAAVAGVIQDTHNRPYQGAQAFVYGADSSIVASGYTDATGYYETNAMAPGTFDLKIVFPNEKIVFVKGITAKKGITPISLKSDMPKEDANISYSDIVPKAAEKAHHNKKKV
jgi:hypothetical protein